LSEEPERGSNDYIDWCTDRQIVQCMGCQNICFRESHTNSDDSDFDGESIETITIYPNPKERQPTIDFWKLPENVRRLYHETLVASNNSAMTLASAGLRSVVEAACIDQGCKRSVLQNMIDELVTKGIFLKRDADYLHQHRFLGNEAVHEMEAPPKEEFEIALKILEHLLRTLYILPELDSELRKLRIKRGAQVL
jgi:hypothetical protein